MHEPPTGIIRTLPPCYFDLTKREGNILAKCIERMNAQESEQLFSFSLSGKPKHEFIHVYIVCDGAVRWRFNFVGFDDKQRECIDGVTRGHFVIVAGPVEMPPRELPMRGFRGFRYTSNLW